MDRRSNTPQAYKVDTNKRPISALVKATITKPFTLELTFKDGTIKHFFMKPYLERHTMFKPFLNPDMFAKFKVNHGCLEWPGNILDFHYEYLYNLPDGNWYFF